MIRPARVVGAALLLAGLFAALGAEGQPTAAAARIGWLGVGGNEGSPAFLNTLREGLAEHGYGVSTLGPDVIGKSLEMLKQAVPGLGAVAILWNPGTSGEAMERNMLAGAEAAGRALNLRLQIVEVRSPGDFDRAFADMTKSRVGALAVLPGTLIPVHRRRVVDLAARHRLPAIYVSMREIVDAGGLMSYGANSADLVRRMAVYVDKIVKGARPGDLPVEQPTKLDLVVNLKAARALGLTFPPSVLTRADQVIE